MEAEIKAKFDSEKWGKALDIRLINNLEAIFFSFKLLIEETKDHSIFGRSVREFTVTIIKFPFYRIFYSDFSSNSVKVSIGWPVEIDWWQKQMKTRCRIKGMKGNQRFIQGKKKGQLGHVDVGKNNNGVILVLHWYTSA